MGGDVNTNRAPTHLVGVGGSTIKATLNKGPRSRVHGNWALLLVKSFKLVLRPLNKGPRPRSIKLWFSLHGIILDEMKMKKKIKNHEKKEEEKRKDQKLT